MIRAIANQVLMIGQHNDPTCEELSRSLDRDDCKLFMEHDLGTAINQAQNRRFDVIVLDAKIGGMSIEKTIQILKNIDANTRIIVKTDSNSKKLEAKVRKEKIYYYHLDSFGLDDLRLAIRSAVSKKPRLSEIQDVSPKKILIVDENDDFIEIHKTNLENHHYEVNVCYDADEAYQEVKKKPPRLIMVDMDIQVGDDGLHFVEKMTANDELSQLPMLLFLSKRSKEKYSAILEKVTRTMPTWNFLHKPVKIEDIIPKVEKLLEK